MSCDELYNLLTIRDAEIIRTLDYISIKRDLLIQIFNIVTKKIENFGMEENECKAPTGSIEDIKTEMSEILKVIYDSCIRNIEDDNNIGFINIFLFMCVIMFTKHLGMIHEFYITRLSIDGKTIFDLLIENDWMNYEYIKTYLSSSKYFNRFIFLTRDVPYIPENLSKYNGGIFLIKWMDKFSSEEIIINYLDDIIYCEIVSYALYADGRCVSPLEYLYHDVVHGINFYYACNEISGINFNEIKNFYLFVKTQYEKNLISRPDFQKIKTLLFYEVHEGNCYVNGPRVKSTLIENERYPRLFDENDLKQLIPKTINTKEKMEEYFKKGIELFKEYWDKWKGPIIVPSSRKERRRLKELELAKELGKGTRKRKRVNKKLKYLNLLRRHYK